MATRDLILEEIHATGVKRAGAQQDMSRYTSWRVGGPAEYLCTVEEPEQLLKSIQVARRHNLPWLVLGGGNNILVSDQGIAGLVMLNRLRGLHLEHDAGSPIVSCGAGIFFAKAAHYTASRGFSGMEWGIAIPGTVGAGVVNNAGAHESEVSRSLVSAEVVDSIGTLHTVLPADLEYHYRQSALKTPHTTQTSLAVTRCRFRLEPADPVAALGRVDELRQHRLRTQPVKEASAGSTFINPPDQFAGALIEQVGLKGYRLGGAQISPLHANFILNVDRATADDIIALIRLARDRVRSQRGIDLIPEVQFVGRWRHDVLCTVLGVAA